MTARTSEAKRAECIRLRVEQQLSTPAIARAVGVCNHTVYGILVDYPWKPTRDRRPIRRGKRWTESDIAYLRTAYPSHPRADILRRLSGRTWQQISAVAGDCGLKRKISASQPHGRAVHPLCQQLRRAREFQGISRTALQQASGLHVGDLHCWETGRTQPRMPYLLRWVAALGFQLVLEPTEQMQEAT